MKTTSGRGGCFYDNIWLDPNATGEFVKDQQGIYEFDKILNSGDDSKTRVKILDHRPVWAKFKTDGNDDDRNVYGKLANADLKLVKKKSNGLESLFYLPDKRIYDNPKNYGLNYEKVKFHSQDGTELDGLFLPAKTKEVVGTVVHFHGNAGNLTGHLYFVQWLPLRGFNVFMFDYRGYGKSKGEPEKQGLYEDSVAALKYVWARDDVDNEKIVVFGQSLGGNNAIAAVGNGKLDWVKAMAIEATFVNYREIAKATVGDMNGMGAMKDVLINSMIDNDYSADKHIKDVKCPVVFIHGSKDQVIPWSHSKKLYGLANKPKQIWINKGGRHIDAFGSKQYQNKLVDFFEEVLKGNKK
ncbi:MAG: alpha/beta hydrolase [Phycisphaerae bacterium]|nr:alpha/beta hydrolase [Phycisphaerae bacterium]